MSVRIVLLNSHNTMNYGTMMMCENVITHMPGDDIEYVVLADDLEESARRLRDATGRSDIEVRPRQVGVVPTFMPRIVRVLVDQVLLRYVNLQRAIGKCDAVILLGGDDLSEYYGRLRVIDIFLRMASMKLARRKVILLGQTVGPFTGVRRRLARMVVDRLDGVYHRGPDSLAYVRDELGCRTEQRVAGDLAFLDLARQDETGILEELGLTRGDYLVLVPSGLSGKYHDTTDGSVEGLASIARHMLGLVADRDGKVVILAHVLRASDDRPLARAIAERVGDERVIAIDRELLPFEARAVLGGAPMNVSQRMHGAISSLEQGVPVVAVSYSVKYADVLGKYLGLPGLVEEADPSGFAATARNTCARIDDVWRDLDGWRGRVAEAVASAKKDVSAHLEEISARLTGRP